ncbi:MAG: hypothetical protein WC375_00155 [Methanomassiliicoccales archaeon]|jgi:hypothetical protein
MTTIKTTKNHSMCPITAKQIADILLRRNIVVLSHKEGNYEWDGKVEITPLIHVQVPTYGGGFHVVRETPDHKFNFSPELKTIDEVVSFIEGLV